MKIIVNGTARDVAGRTVQAALVELGFDDQVVATAHNGEFVSATVRASTVLAEGDRLEILAPMQGG